MEHKFNVDGFMLYLTQQFPPMDYHFTYDMTENLVRYGMDHFGHTCDGVVRFLSTIMPEMEFGEIAMFEDDENLTDFGRSEKYEAIEKNGHPTAVYYHG